MKYSPLPLVCYEFVLPERDNCVVSASIIAVIFLCCCCLFRHGETDGATCMAEIYFGTTIHRNLARTLNIEACNYSSYWKTCHGVEYAALEFAYCQAPGSMKCVIMSLYLVTFAIGDVLTGV